MNWFAGATVVLLSENKHVPLILLQVLDRFEVTLQPRLYAMYGKTRKILLVLLVTTAITVVLLLTFIIRLVKTQSGAPPLLCYESLL